MKQLSSLNSHRKNIIELKIYFPALSYEMIEEYEAYSLGDLQCQFCFITQKVLFQFVSTFS